MRTKLEEKNKQKFFSKYIISFFYCPSSCSCRSASYQDSTIKLPAPTHQDMVDWIEKSRNYTYTIMVIN